MLGRTDSRRRTLVVLLVFLVTATSLVARLGYWQMLRRDEMADMAAEQTSLRVEVPTRRGAIYDRTGTVVLASTVERDLLAANPKLLEPERRREVAAALLGILGLSGDAATALVARMTSERQYVVLAKDLSPEQSQRIRDLSTGPNAPLAGLVLEPQAFRVYPQAGGGPSTTLAAQLMGFVNRQGEGQYGVEQFYQDALAGAPKVMLAERDINQQPIADTASILEPGAQGEDLTLTIDASLQLAVEQELLQAWIADRAKSASAVVMDPYTGAVYAYASYPSYDQNDYAKIASKDASAFVDPIASSVYEPGSVFKMLTAIAALEGRTVTPTTRIRDTGKLVVDHGRAHVDDADHRAMGTMTFQDAIAYSRNVVAAKVALGLAPTTKEAATDLYDAWMRLGFGAPSGIDVAGEVGGIVRDPAVDPWAEIDLANGSFGQGIAVTPIQLAQAYAAMVNGGELVQPRVVASVGGRDTEPIVRRRVLTPDLSRTLMRLMTHVVTEVDFYRDRTLIPGFEVGGKTGTAQIWDVKHRRWKTNLFNYSFVGYIARAAGYPDLVVAVRIEEGRPTTVRMGHLEMPVMSFELFRRVAHDAINTPDLIPERPTGPIVVADAKP
jgi:cell division protein FtsI/penicillin-binding protein 2